MVGRQAGARRQYGDFQTPPHLAGEVCALLVRSGVRPRAILEPTCGEGAFLAAAVEAFPGARVLGAEIDPTHAATARRLVGEAATVEEADFFGVDWRAVLDREPGPWLVIGNPPWVTNTEIGLLGGSNLPVKSNFQGHSGLDAITGRANFDISEWMIGELLRSLEGRQGWLAMLIKTSVARKVLKAAWQRGAPIGRAAIHGIDAKRNFGAAVDACLLVLPVGGETSPQDCDVHPDLVGSPPTTTIGLHDGMLVSDVATWRTRRGLIGRDPDRVWRSGIKHDCSRVMELVRDESGMPVNGFGEPADLEPDFLYPLLKSSDVARGAARRDRLMLVPQRQTSADTAEIAAVAPRTWAYLLAHADRLDARGSSIYRGRPRFSVFGVGAYSFAPWKVAVSGFYRSLGFMKVGPVDGRPVVFDDTVYFLACRSEEEADFVLSLVRSREYGETIGSMVFGNDKRPITAELLGRVSLARVAEALGRSPITGTERTGGRVDRRPDGSAEPAA